MRRSVDTESLSEAARAAAGWGPVGDAPWRAPEVSRHLERLALALPRGDTGAVLPAAVSRWRVREIGLRDEYEAYVEGLARAAIAYERGEHGEAARLARTSVSDPP